MGIMCLQLSSAKQFNNQTKREGEIRFRVNETAIAKNDKQATNDDYRPTRIQPRNKKCIGHSRLTTTTTILFSFLCVCVCVFGSVRWIRSSSSLSIVPTLYTLNSFVAFVMKNYVHKVCVFLCGEYIHPLLDLYYSTH